MFVIGICTAMLFMNAWVLFGHRSVLGTDSRDQAPKNQAFPLMRLWVGFALILLAQTAGLYRRILLEMGYWRPMTLWEAGLDFLPLPANGMTFTLGFLVFVFGLVLRLYSIWLLGRLFTFEVGIRVDHEIIEVGPYRYIRHPSYTGYGLMLVGISIAYASLLGLIVSVAALTLFLHFRIPEEEEVLIYHFGDRYKVYMSRTKRLLPFVF